MSGLSKLFSPSSNIIRSSILFLNKSASTLKSSGQLVKNVNPGQLMLTQFRESHGRTMFIRPGKFYSKKLFDMLVSREIAFSVIPWCIYHRVNRIHDFDIKFSYGYKIVWGMWSIHLYNPIRLFRIVLDNLI